MTDFRRAMSKDFGVTLASSRIASVGDGNFVNAKGAAGTLKVSHFLQLQMVNL